MNKQIKVMEDYALKHHVPIMQKAGIQFLCDYIKEHQVKTILEIGSAIGYSAICMAMMNDDIRVVTVERDEVRYLEAVKNIEIMGLQDRITIYHMDAFDFESSEQFDLLFIDAAKAQYIKFFEKFKHNVKKDGVIITDNLEFHGMVSGEVKIEHSRNLRQLVRKIKEYVVFLEENEEFMTEYVKIGDGIAISSWK